MYWVRKLSFVCAALIAVCGLFAAVAAAEDLAASKKPAESAEPQIFAPNPMFDFGEVRQGEKVVHSFEIKNAGSGDLHIKQIQPACGCTAAVSDQNAIAPGESAHITATFDTAGFQGQKVKTIRVYNNDSKNPSIELGFRGFVKTDVMLDPSRLYFGKISKGQTPSRTTVVAVEPTAKISIGEVTSRSEDLEVIVEDLSSPKSGKKVTAKILDSAPVGVFRTQIVVRTSSKRNPVINVPVFARIEGDLRLQPSEVSFGLLEGPLKKSVKQTVKLSNNGEGLIHIKSVESSHPSVDVAINKLKPGKEYELVVTVKAGTIGKLQGRVEVKTDHQDKEQRAVSFPVYGIIARKGT